MCTAAPSRARAARLGSEHWAGTPQPWRDGSSLCNSSPTAQNADEARRKPKLLKIWTHQSEQQGFFRTAWINNQQNWTASGDSQAERAAGTENQADVQKKKPRAHCRAGKSLQNFQRTHSWLHRSWTNRFRNIPFYWYSMKRFQLPLPLPFPYQSGYHVEIIFYFK